MEAISVNAPARHVRDRLPPKDGKQADVDWSAFEVMPCHPWLTRTMSFLSLPNVHLLSLIAK